jgi:hypothetical protein
MNILGIQELEGLVRKSFPAKALFSAGAELGLERSRLPVVTFVHGGPDPFLDRELDAWLAGAPRFVQLYPLLNRLCRDGALPPGEYAISMALQ